MAMGIAFEFSNNIHQLLFQTLNIGSLGGIIAACILLSILSLAYEGIKLAREFLMAHLAGKFSSAPSCQINQNQTEESQLRPPCCKDQPSTSTRLKIHTAQTILHLIQILVGYILMLCVMTYNAWLTIAIVLATGLGYFLFGAILTKEFLVPEYVETKCSKPDKQRGSGSNNDGDASGPSQVHQHCHNSEPPSYSSINNSVSTVISTVSQ